MKLILIFFLILTPLLSNSQQKSNDTLLYTCSYKFTWQKDPKIEFSKYIDNMVLDIYKNYSSFYSTNRQKGLKKTEEDRKNQTPFETIMKNKAQYHLDAETQILYTFQLENKFLALDKIEAKIAYKVVDTFGFPIWQINADTMTILNQPCQKATTTFRGRDYIAWFASNIPFQSGPWKFNSLPGLIIKVNDTKNQFAFECVAISSKTNRTKNIIQYNNYKTISLDKLNKLRKQKAEYPLLFAQQQNPEITITSGGQPITPTQKEALPYNPIELKLKL